MSVQVKFLLAGEPLAMSSEVLTVTGRPGNTLTTTTGTNKCGSYRSDEFDTYSTSATGFSGTLNEKAAVVVNSNDYRKDRMQSPWWIGTPPAPGSKVHSIALYKEDAVNDDGECVENGATYYKYTGMID